MVGVGAVFGAILAGAFLAGGSGRDQSDERRNLETRAAQLTAQVLARSSPLACLDGMAGENVEAACEKALFAAPATVAAASSYVAARLTLLSDVVAYIKAGGKLDSVLLPLRHSLEADRFGFVAHILAVRDGCTSGHCMALALLRDPERVRANLSAQTLDRYVDRYLQTWGQSSDFPLAEVAPSATAGPNHKKGVIDADFPSAASIPAIGIMNPEPKTSPANAAADAKMRGTGSARTPSRKNTNSPAQALASPAASLPATSLAPPADPVWVPGTAPITPQPSPSQARRQ